MPVKLIAPPHTPLTTSGALNLEVVAAQANYFRDTGVSGVFICGSTGEGPSLTVDERVALAECWAAHSEELDLIVQVGSNSQPDAIRLAAHAADVGATAISALAPCYFKPATVASLIDYFEPIARAAGQLPFYFYDIPALTGVELPTVDFLRQAGGRIASLAGVKFTNSDLIQFQECVRLDQGRYEIWFGCDEALLAGYALGARGAVGSTYNFAASLYHDMIAAYDDGDLETARAFQAKSVALVRICQSYGYAAAAKTVMSFLGIDCGPVRSPLGNLNPRQVTDLRQELNQLNVLHPIGA